MASLSRLLLHKHSYSASDCICATGSIASQLTVQAEVKYYQPGIGMGIEFIDLNYNQHKEIAQLIEDIKLSDSKNSM